MLLYLTLLLFTAGWLADMYKKDPNVSWHPIVVMGQAIAFFEHSFNQGTHRTLKGGVVALGLIVATFLLVLLVELGIVGLISYLQSVMFSRFVLIVGTASMLLYGLMVFLSLSGYTLIYEVRAVFEQLSQSLDQGRKQVARIVGRDTNQLTENEVAAAALETLSENLSDGVVAPMCWYALFGLPGMLAYKMTNTLDSMIGYKNSRYLAFGRVAAKVDDVANYLPARLTAMLMVLVSGQWRHFSFVRRYAHAHASPNSGYPESALAAILNCRFGGPHDYFGELVEKPYIGHNERAFTYQDMELAVKINRRVELVMGLITIALRMAIISLFFIFI